jgi:hypothetical protein
LPDEDPAEYAELLDAYEQREKPVGPLEECLVRQLAMIDLRLKRVPWYEAGLLRRRMYGERLPLSFNLPAPLVSAAYVAAEADMQHKRTAAENDVGSAFAAAETNEELTRLIRYETHLQRLYARTLHDLRAEQDRRRGHLLRKTVRVRDQA